MGNEQYKGRFFDSFGMLHDIRQQGKVVHDLIDVLFIIVSAVFAKVDEVEEIYIWAVAEQNKKWLKKYIALKNGIPSISTFRRVLNAVDPKQFEKCFISWTKELTVFSENGGDIVAIDGKTMRGSRDGDKITHIVSAWCSVNNLVLGQVKTEDKSNEITAIPELLDLLYIEGCIVTIDAMGCQTKIVEKIIKKKADYVISLKGNQGTLHNEVKEYYEDLKEDMAEIETGNHESVKVVKTLDKGHGRIEERKYYIGSIKDISQFAKAVRGHWGIESVHWSLDVTFKDDANKTRKDLAPQNLAVAKRIVLNMVRNETEEFPKWSANKKRLMASLDVEYRTRVFDINFKK